MIKTRLAALRRLLKKQNLDALLVTLPANRRYLSGFSPDDGQWGESSGCLLISQTAAFLLTDFRYELTARAQAPYFETLIYHQGLAPLVGMIAPELGLKNLAYESEAMLDMWRSRLEQHLPGVELKPTLGLVSQLRVHKNSAEINGLVRQPGPYGKGAGPGPVRRANRPPRAGGGPVHRPGGGRRRGRGGQFPAPGGQRTQRGRTPTPRAGSGSLSGATQSSSTWGPS